EFYAGQQFQPGGSPRVTWPVRRGGIQFRGNCQRGGSGQIPRGMDERRAAEHRFVVGGHSALRSLGQPTFFFARTSHRSVGTPLSNGLAQPRTGDGPPLASQSAPGTSGGARRLFRRQERVGTSQLVCPRRCPAARGLFVWPPE